MMWSTNLMTRRTQLCVFVAILALAPCLPGCEKSNEKSANITGTVPPADNLTSEQRRQKQQGGMSDAKGVGYPGAGGPTAKPGDSTPANKRIR
jgi:hypothetical protein